MSLNLQDRIANFLNRLGGKRGDRPWGYYLVLFVDEGYKVKRFLVYPGQRLSLQRQLSQPIYSLANVCVNLCGTHG